LLPFADDDWLAAGVNKPPFGVPLAAGLWPLIYFQEVKLLNSGKKNFW
jgi:hypothetical protein